MLCCGFLVIQKTNDISVSLCMNNRNGGRFIHTVFPLSKILMHLMFPRFIVNHLWLYSKRKTAIESQKFWKSSFFFENIWPYFRKYVNPFCGIIKINLANVNLKWFFPQYIVHYKHFWHFTAVCCNAGFVFKKKKKMQQGLSPNVTFS